MTPQMVPGLVPELKPLPPLRVQYEASKRPDKLEELKGEASKKAAEARGGDPDAKAAAKKAQGSYQKALKASTDEAEREAMRVRLEELEQIREAAVGGVQIYQEMGGLAGRFALAWLALRILSRRRLLRLFQIPGLLIIPLVYWFPAAGNLPDHNVEWLRAGLFLAGFFTIAQFSFWGNYLPRMYPTHLRGTGESFAANVGGRMVGTAANPLTGQLALAILAAAPALPRPTGTAYAAAIVAFLVYAVGSLLTFFLPEPTDKAED
jgi:hypothetical protein